MSMRKGTEKEDLRKLIVLCEKSGKRNKVALWRYAAELLSLPRRRSVVVNVGKIARILGENEVALVPGKLLGDGIIERKLRIAAYCWTPTAKKRVEDAGGEVMCIEKLIEMNPKATNVRIMR
ncbi:MAG: 50S ribosomal protein L18e [Candidatus Micrarchaeia archaeon]